MHSPEHSNPVMASGRWTTRSGGDVRDTAAVDHLDSVTMGARPGSSGRELEGVMHGRSARSRLRRDALMPHVRFAREDGASFVVRVRPVAQLQEKRLDGLRNAHATEQQAEQMLRGQLALRTLTRCQGAGPFSPRRHASSTGTGSRMHRMARRVAVVVQGSHGQRRRLRPGGRRCAAASAAGNMETACVCERILAQEQGVADRVLSRLPSLTRTFLALDATEGAEAKR